MFGHYIILSFKTKILSEKIFFLFFLIRSLIVYQYKLIFDFLNKKIFMTLFIPRIVLVVISGVLLFYKKKNFAIQKHCKIIKNIVFISTISCTYDFNI